MREAENKGSPNILPKSKDWAAVARGIENWTVQRTLQENFCIYIISYTKENYNVIWENNQIWKRRWSCQRITLRLWNKLV
jgi:hypothetical protein